MTITHREFFRILPIAIKLTDYKQFGNEITAVDGSRAIKISLSDESIRKIGSFSLPITNMRMELSGFNESELSEFLSAFDLAFQKGGG